MMVNNIFKSKILVFLLIFSFLFLIAAEAAPNIVDSDSNKEFKPVVRAKEGGEKIPADQKERLDKLIQEGKKLLQEDMDYEAAIKKFKEAKNLAVTRIQKADVFFNLSLAHYANQSEKGTKELFETIRELIEQDYYRELDELVCPQKYIELFEGIKKEYGVLRIQSKPVGADVYLNESKVPVGKTPLTIGSKPGSVKIKIKKGRKVKKDILEVAAGKETASSIYVLKGLSTLLYVVGGVVLAGSAGAIILSSGAGEGEEGESPTTGSIQVNSTPQGATVYLDGTATGETTNCTLSNLSPGSHTVKLVKEGYEDYEQTISVTAGQTTTINVTLTIITITVTNPISSTIWTKGSEAEIRWETSGSSSFKAHVNTSTGLKPLLRSGRNLLPSFQRRAFQYKRSFRNSIKTRRELENINSSRTLKLNSSNNKKIDLNKSSKSQGVSKKISPLDRESKTFRRRERNIRNIKKNDRFGRINLPVAKGVSPQIIKPSGNTRALALTNVNIDLYKGDSQVITIATSIENDGTHTWQIPPDLEDASDYKVRISCASAPDIYGESSPFTIEEKSITVTEPTGDTVWIKGNSANITWTSKGTINDVRIDLYRGGTFTQTIIDSTANTGSYTWIVDPSLSEGPNYKVRISSVNDLGIYGESDRFAISEQMSITVTKPTGSTIWNKGKSADINWASTGIIDDVKIELFKGSTLEKTIESSTMNEGFYTWDEVDPNLADGPNYRIRISFISNSGVYGESPAFRIEKKSITIINPTSSTVWIKGQEVNITWTNTGVINNVKIELYKGSTLERTIETSTSNDGSHSWTVDGTLADGDNYKVKIYDTNDSKDSYESDEFTISTAKSITITEPTIGSVWIKGDEAEMAWTNTGVIDDVKIELYKGSTLERTIETSTPNDGSYSWTVDGTLADGDNYRIKVTDADDSAVSDESDEFTISAQKSLTITNPTSSTVWIKDSSADIEWDSTGQINNMKIELYKGSTLERTIETSTPNDGSHSWTVDGALADGDNYKIKITDADDSGVSDESDEFTISAQKSLTITNPTSSTVWIKDSSVDIEWDSTGFINNVKIELYKGSTLERTIESETPNDGSYSWTVDGTLADGDNYKIKITDVDDSGVSDESDEFGIGS